MKRMFFILLGLLLIGSAFGAASFDSETGEQIPGYQFLTPDVPEAPSTAVEESRDVDAWSGTGPWGGNVRCLTTDPANNMHVFAACGSTVAQVEGGVYQSTDGGLTWANTTLPRKQFNTVASSAAQPGTFYAGARNGLYKSTDNGATWVLYAQSSAYILGLGVSPLDGNAIVMGKSGGVGFQMSFDGGNSFSNTTVTTGFMRQFAWSASDPGRMFVVMGTSTSSIMTSIDNGLTWTGIGPAGNGWGMYVSPTNEQFVLLAHDSGIYRTVNGGTSWDLVYTGAFKSVVEYNGILYATANAGGVYESNDQGLTWVNYNVGVVQSTWQTGATSGAGALLGHWGGIFRGVAYQQPILVSHTGLNLALVHGLAYYADTNELWGGAEGSGVYRSTDGGATWQQMVNGLNNWMVYELQPTNHQYYQSGRMLAGTLDGAYTSLDGGNTWSYVHYAGMQVSACEVHPTNPDIFWVGSSLGEIKYTFDGGETFNVASGGMYGFAPRLKLGRGPSGNLRLFLTYQNNGNCNVWYSDDLGVSFISGSGTASTTYQPMVVTRPTLGAQQQLVYVSTGTGSTGAIYKSTDNGLNYSATNMTGFSWSVLCGPGQQVVSGNSNGVTYSPDEGATFTSLTQNLEPSANIWQMAWGANTNQVYIALRTRGVMENRFSDTVYGLPTNLVATPGNLQLALTWTPVTTTPEPIEYWIWRDGYPVASVQGDQNSYTDTGLVNNQNYKYFVSAVYEGDIHTSAVQIITAAPQAPSGMPPAAPENLTVSINGDLLYLDWNTVTEDVLGNPITVLEYNVYAAELPYFDCTDEYLYTVTSDHSLVLEDLVGDINHLFFKVTAVAADM